MTYNMEIITSTDKAARNRLFDDLRYNGNELEKQVVKFSSNEPVLGEAGTQEGHFVFYDKKQKKPQWRPLFRSTWSVAYPRS